jgi:hypothetical protein
MKRAVVVGTLLAGALAAQAARAASIVIDVADAAGQGLNDPTPFTPVGGNTASTLGAARLAVFQQAAAVWGASLPSQVTIRVNAQFTTLTCSSSSAVLAMTGATSLHMNFLNAPVSNTWYPQALANSLAGTDLDPTTDDITTEFNSGLGGASCLAGVTWYLGLDAQPGSGQIDMLTVLLHEFAHGLGFQTFEDPTTGAEINGFPDAFLLGMGENGATPAGLGAMTDTERVAANVSDPNLYWSGTNVNAAASSLTAGLVAGHPRLYGPTPVVLGSSLSHYAQVITPHELMEPAYTGPNRNLTLTLALLHDIGWPALAANTVVPALPGSTLWLLGLALALAAVRRLRRASSRCVR